MKLRTAVSFATALAALGVVACTSPTTSEGGDTSAADLSTKTSSATRVHVMPLHAASNDRSKPLDVSGPAGAKLTYFGGPVLSSVKVWTVYWGASVQFQDHINAFFPAITNSVYFDWLSEYNTASATIGRGSFGGSVVDTSAPSGTKVSDAQVQTEIGKLIDAGKLPPNDGSNLYMVYFAPGVTVTGPNGSGTSCQEFCAYHGTFTKSGKNAYYGVMPDLGGACSSGCGNGTQQDNITEVSAHEMIEAVTDPAVGLATTAGAPLAWYDQTNGEIGDICAGNAGQVAGFTVQLEWSNKLKKCTATAGLTDTGGSSSSSSSSSGASGSSSSGGSSSGSTSSSGGSTSGSTSSSGAPGDTCSHDVCTAGAKLTATCDACATQVCAQDAFCCKSKWDASCVKEVASVCGQTCN